ncbi:hypothetical protein Pelo_19138 [Pelomyxa schiedti]|nr:hypothetical protein Pelo_19138 [Pelomyxa schiedti]
MGMGIEHLTSPSSDFCSAFCPLCVGFETKLPVSEVPFNLCSGATHCCRGNAQRCDHLLCEGGCHDRHNCIPIPGKLILRILELLPDCTLFNCECRQFFNNVNPLTLHPLLCCCPIQPHQLQHSFLYTLRKFRFAESPTANHHKTTIPLQGFCFLSFNNDLSNATEELFLSFTAEPDARHMRHEEDGWEISLSGTQFEYVTCFLPGFHWRVRIAVQSDVARTACALLHEKQNTGNGCTILISDVVLEKSLLLSIDNNSKFTITSQLFLMECNYKNDSEAMFIPPPWPQRGTEFLLPLPTNNRSLHPTPTQPQPNYEQSIGMLLGPHPRSKMAIRAVMERPLLQQLRQQNTTTRTTATTFNTLVQQEHGTFLPDDDPEIQALLFSQQRP